ncbi:MAG: tetratricopeptide repeat protein [Candidatus Latescibacterota bacterium]
MSARFLFVFAAALLIVNSPEYLWANDAPVKSVGKAIQPLKDVPVRMVAEEVRIYLSAASAYVSCLFTLRNEGTPGTIEVGFPRGWEGDLINFTAKNARIPGTYPVKTLAEMPEWGEFNNAKLPWWKVFEVSFDASAPTVVVENAYTSHLRSRDNLLMADLHFTYIMTTGAPWKGPIGDAAITVYLRNIPFEQITHISPQGYTRAGNQIRWHFTNFEPSQNIEIGIMTDILYERLTTARKVLEKSPENAYAHYLLGTVYYHQDLLKDPPPRRAEKELLAAIAHDPTLWDARWFLALEYMHLNRDTHSLKDIKTQLDAIIQGNPEYRCLDKTFYLSDAMGSNEPKDMVQTLILNKWK